MTDPYRVVVSGPARRQLHRLPERVAVAIIEFVTVDLPDHPARRSKPLVGELQGLRSARRGDYRVLLKIDEIEHLVVVVRVAHRADAYRTPPS